MLYEEWLLLLRSNSEYLEAEYYVYGRNRIDNKKELL